MFETPSKGQNDGSVPEVTATPEEVARTKDALVTKADDLIAQALSIIESNNDLPPVLKTDQLVAVIISDLELIHFRVQGHLTSPRSYETKKIITSEYTAQLIALRDGCNAWLQAAEAASQKVLKGQFTEPLPLLMSEIAGIANMPGLVDLKISEDLIQQKEQIKPQADTLIQTGQKKLQTLFSVLGSLPYVPVASSEGSALFGKTASVVEQAKQPNQREQLMVTLYQFLTQNGFTDSSSFEVTGEVSLTGLFNDLEAWIVTTEKYLSQQTGQGPAKAEDTILRRKLALVRNIESRFITPYLQIDQRVRTEQGTPARPVEPASNFDQSYQTESYTDAAQTSQQGGGFIGRFRKIFGV